MQIWVSEIDLDSDRCMIYGQNHSRKLSDIVRLAKAHNTVVLTGSDDILEKLIELGVPEDQVIPLSKD